MAVAWISLAGLLRFGRCRNIRESLGTRTIAARYYLLKVAKLRMLRFLSIGTKYFAGSVCFSIWFVVSFQMFKELQIMEEVRVDRAARHWHPFSSRYLLWAEFFCTDLNSVKISKPDKFIWKKKKWRLLTWQWCCYLWQLSFLFHDYYVQWWQLLYPSAAFVAQPLCCACKPRVLNCAAYLHWTLTQMFLVWLQNWASHSFVTVW